MDNPNLEQKSKGIAVASGSRADRFSVLVVDDDLVLRMVHKAILNKLGLDVQEVKNGKEAVELHVDGAAFNLILMDKEMPVMDGCQAVRSLRAMGVDTNIVGVTSCDSVVDLNEFKEAGLTDCVSKPLNIQKIVGFLPPNILESGGSRNSSDSD